MKEYIIPHDGKMFEGFPELVRCKDCKHYMQPDGSEKGDCFIKMGYFPVSEDWYCADGERR